VARSSAGVEEGVAPRRVTTRRREEEAAGEQSGGESELGIGRRGWTGGRRWWAPPVVARTHLDGLKGVGLRFFWDATHDGLRGGVGERLHRAY
jgi:hypothetical protein